MNFFGRSAVNRFYKGACLGREIFFDLVKTFFYSLLGPFIPPCRHGISKISKYVYNLSMPSANMSNLGMPSVYPNTMRGNIT